MSIEGVQEVSDREKTTRLHSGLMDAKDAITSIVRDNGGDPEGATRKKIRNLAGQGFDLMDILAHLRKVSTSDVLGKQSVKVGKTWCELFQDAIADILAGSSEHSTGTQ
jgi:hypothetical protein